MEWLNIKSNFLLSQFILYHFPRHWNLFNRNFISLLSEKTGFEIEIVRTVLSQFSWVYSIHNFLESRHKSDHLSNRFTLKSTVSLMAFTAVDFILQKFEPDVLPEATFRKPGEENKIDKSV